MSDDPNNVSFLRFESCSFDNQRFSTEVKITQLSSSKISYSLISDSSESDIGKFMDISYIERYPLSQRINLILALAFVNNAKFCKGATLEDGETTTLPHVTGQYVDFSKGTESVGETRVFSNNCNIITVKDGTCWANCRNIINFWVPELNPEGSREILSTPTQTRDISPRLKLCKNLPKKGKHDKTQRKGSDIGDRNSIPSALKWLRKITMIFLRCF